MTAYDEQTYSCQRGDTWEGISKRFYQSDRYARALQRHNQIHIRASDQMARTGQPSEGDRIFVPQSRVLEGMYADAIPPQAAPSPPTMVPTNFVPPSGMQPQPNR